MTHDNGIEVEGLVREFKNGPRAVDGIDLRVEPGEIYGFLGPNGAGKSTTVLMLTTLLPPTAGTARVAGHDIVKEAAARKVRGYSGGMKRRLDLALALVHHPRILFLDEPTTGLDPQSRSDMWQEVARLAREDGVTVFLTTQYLEEADVLADHLAIIDRGRIVARGTPETLKAEIGRPSLEITPADRSEREGVAAVLERFGTPVAAQPGVAAIRMRDGTDEIADVERALDAEGYAIADLQLMAPSLDDVFLAKTGHRLEISEEAGE